MMESECEAPCNWVSVKEAEAIGEGKGRGKRTGAELRRGEDDVNSCA